MDLKLFASKEAYPIVRQLEKITVKKAQVKVVKCAKNKSWVPRNSLGHSSVKHAIYGMRMMFLLSRINLDLMIRKPLNDIM